MDGKEYSIGKRRINFFEYLHPEKRGKVFENSEVFPLKIECLDYIRCTFEADKFEFNSSTPYVIHLGTNRGYAQFNGTLPETTNSVKEFLQYLK
ncbi:hypothetical protein [uncultured Agathobaculum sp.]|uniref:hypothetical protein n=1 Tax=uncultured Agathobaculum sp. TaxID=2048140 RepID=UPI00320ABA95